MSNAVAASYIFKRLTLEFHSFEFIHFLHHMYIFSDNPTTFLVYTENGSVTVFAKLMIKIMAL